jgi:aspartyl-tRNA(Asn)/glutamyl-tRNA(Gln) amidotransferase subunit B
VDGKVTVLPSNDTTNTLQHAFVLPIQRVQLEQDTAKSTRHRTQVHLNFNRTSIPLIEIVTPPTLRSAHETSAAVHKLITLLRNSGTCTAELHLGALRCDVNISLGLGFPRTEIKNLNSLRAVRDSCAIEIARQTEMVLRGEEVVSSTMTWDGTKTRVLRRKLGEEDYRFMPEGNVPPIMLSEDFLKKVRERVPVDTEEVVLRLVGEPYLLREEQARRLSLLPKELRYFESLFEKANMDGVSVYNWYCTRRWLIQGGDEIVTVRKRCGDAD